MNKEELLRVLRFYADPLRYQGPNQRYAGPEDPYAPTPDFPYLWDVTRDNGDIARKAVAQLEIDGLRED